MNDVLILLNFRTSRKRYSTTWVLGKCPKPYRQVVRVFCVHAKLKGLLGLGTLGVHSILAFSLQPSLPRLMYLIEELEPKIILLIKDVAKSLVRNRGPIIILLYDELMSNN